METAITLLSWNVNGVRAIHRKGFLPWLEETAPDILCLQETKAMESQLPTELAQPASYQAYWNSAQRKKGYSGTALIIEYFIIDKFTGGGAANNICLWKLLFHRCSQSSRLKV